MKIKDITIVEDFDLDSDLVQEVKNTIQQKVNELKTRYNDSVERLPPYKFDMSHMMDRTKIPGVNLFDELAGEKKEFIDALVPQIWTRVSGGKS